MIGFDQYAYTNKLFDMHPAEKFFFAVVSMFICIFANSPSVSIVILLTMGVATIWWAGIPGRVFMKMLLMPVSFLLIGVLSVAVIISSTPENFIFSFKIGAWFLGTTKPGLMLALNIFLKSLGAVSCLYFLSLTTSMIDIISVLRKLKVPAIFLELMMLVYRFIFALIETAYTMITSQASRLGYKSTKTAFVSLGRMFSNLFLKAFFHAKTLNVSMESRCYSGEIHVLEREYDVSLKNVFIILSLQVFFIIVAIL